VSGTDAEATYDYVDESGELLFQVVRLPGKQFFQRRPTADGGFVNGLGDARRVLYRLPQVRAHISENRREPLFVVEGERDVHAIEAAVAVATCNPGGALKWTDDYSEALMGARSVVVVADRDEPGRRHARRVVESLARVGVAAEVVEALAGKDASDHLAAGHGLSDFVPVALAVDAEEFAAVEVAQLVVEPVEEFAAVDEPGADSLASTPNGEAVIPADGVVLVYGSGGSGKTTLTLDLCFALAAGESWPD
jgi:5S rRNA maturation endonuclease (ribonuclease M5)